jgi:hypothetical protein
MSRETERIGEWMQTYAGVKFYPRDPRPSDIKIEDIAHGLSLLCRFGGQCTQFYSVAEHAVRVSRLVEELGGTPHEIFWGLNHDDSEAYLGDVVWPLKQAPEMQGYLELEALCMAAICDALGMPLEQPAIVKHADLVMLATEKRDLMQGDAKTVSREAIAAKAALGDWHCDHLAPHPVPIATWSSADAKHAFLERYALCAERRLGKRW